MVYFSNSKEWFNSTPVGDTDDGEITWWNMFTKLWGNVAQKKEIGW